MNITEHLLACLAEECDEVSKECHKALRFGLDDKVTMNPLGPRGTEGPTNREKILTELNDLLGVVDMLVSRGILPRNWNDPIRRQRKGDRVMMYMSYAFKVGALENHELSSGEVRKL